MCVLPWKQHTSSSSRLLFCVFSSERSPFGDPHGPPHEVHVRHAQPVLAAAREAQRLHPRLRDQILREGERHPTSRGRFRNHHSIKLRQRSFDLEEGFCPYSPCLGFQGQAMSHTVTAQYSSAKVEGLKSATQYVVQVRARTVAGYGRYSNPMDFSTSLHSTDPQHSSHTFHYCF